MLAVAEDAVEVISDLIVAGADPLARDGSGHDAAHRVRQLLKGAVPTALARRGKKAVTAREKGAKKKAAKKKGAVKKVAKKKTRKKATRKKATRKGAKKSSRKKVAN